ncbi:helix-turn-helix transcriptional regulator [Halogeometricum luteum]|uniref:DUF1724 domain-containing protein n=1 Tax=Halogeometricum luteum TaxID=2950537 RepID=A0ABU2G0D1_9EURY|nr:transcriptional regulator FilR1 domain-containing protein [Halogeometricum sp. S3BR5-2]MDS0294251.1 DUF1724 domain-containing protein [Halogeometricum sp. S3BR5-2]
MDDDDLVEVVKRLPILEALRNGPQSAGGLEERLSFSRSTVHRATNALGALGMIRKRDGEFELTSFGRVAVRRLSECRRDLDIADRLSPFLNAVDADVAFPVAALSDAAVTSPDRGQAHFAVKRVSDLMRESKSLRTFSAVVSPVYVDICCRQARRGASVEAVFDRRVVDILFDEYGPEAREAIRGGDLEVLICDDCPFELFVFDDCVAMTAHGSGGERTPFVESSNPDLYEWAEDLFVRYKSDAEFATVF